MKKWIKSKLIKYLGKPQENHFHCYEIKQDAAWTSQDADNLKEFLISPFGQRFLNKLHMDSVQVGRWAISNGLDKNFDNACGVAEGFEKSFINILNLADLIQISKKDSDKQVTESLLERLKT